MEGQLDDKQVEPNSGLGQALRYMLKHWKGLTLFLRKAGAPVDNNIVERSQKKAIIHRKKSLFYRSGHGVEVGDIFMSLIYTCESCQANPFDYLQALQQHAEVVAQRPEQWQPWNYQLALRARQPAPWWRRIGPRRIAAHQQHVQLMRFEGQDRRCRSGPEGEAPARQALLAKPKTIAVIDQNFDRPAPPVGENKQGTAEGIGRQLPPAQAGHGIDAGAKIDRFDRDQNPHVRRDLDHCARQKASARLASPLCGDAATDTGGANNSINCAATGLACAGPVRRHVAGAASASRGQASAPARCVARHAVPPSPAPPPTTRPGYARHVGDPHAIAQSVPGLAPGFRQRQARCPSSSLPPIAKGNTLVKLFLLADTNNKFQLYADGDLVNADIPGFHVTKIHLEANDKTVSLALDSVVSTGFVLPARLLKEFDPGVFRLASRTELAELAGDEWSALRERARQRMAQPFVIKL
eukprot:gene32838-40535_t